MMMILSTEFCRESLILGRITFHSILQICQSLGCGYTANHGGTPLIRKFAVASPHHGADAGALGFISCSIPSEMQELKIA